VIDVALGKGRETHLWPSLDFRKGPVSLDKLTPPDAQISINEVVYPIEKGKRLVYLPVGNQTVQIRKNGFRPVEREMSIAEKNTSVLDVQLEAVFGSLNVTSDPAGADVYFSGKKLGVTPFHNPHFPVGTHDIRIQKGNQFAVKRVTVDENKETVTQVSLKASMGLVRLLVNPWANIYVDGKKIGVSPPMDNLELRPGEYQVKMENPAFRPVIKKVIVKAGSTVTLQYEFK